MNAIRAVDLDVSSEPFLFLYTYECIGEELCFTGICVNT